MSHWRPLILALLAPVLLIGAVVWPVQAAAPPIDRVAIPALNVTADVLPTGQWRESQPDYDPNAWLLTTIGDQVGWLDTGDHGGPGNLILVGHYTVPPSGQPGAFYRLNRLEDGDFVYIKQHDGVTWAYRVIDSRLVDDDDLSILADSGDDRLTLIGCNGADTAHRRVVVAESLGPVVCARSGGGLISCIE